MIPGSPAVSGIDAIRANAAEMASDPALSLNFKSDRIGVAKSGDLAYTQGTYTITLTDPLTKQIIHDHGSYVTTYRKQPDGAWKAIADIASSAVPMIPPAPPPTTHAKAAGKKHAKKQTKKGKK
jgi:ketosteroid isomerase-like protein